jgi:hypothetical protein
VKQSHSGHEQIVVQSGAIEVRIEYYAPSRLGIGDSISFDRSLGHAVLSVSEDPAVVLWICDSQDFAR